MKNVTCMDSTDYMKLALWQELQNALKIKRINDELLLYLSSSLRWLIHYSEKNRLYLPDKDKIIEMLNRIMEIADRLPPTLPTESQQRNKTTGDPTEPNLVI